MTTFLGLLRMPPRFALQRMLLWLPCHRAGPHTSSNCRDTALSAGVVPASSRSRSATPAPSVLKSGGGERPGCTSSLEAAESNPARVAALHERPARHVGGLVRRLREGLRGEVGIVDHDPLDRQAVADSRIQEVDAILAGDLRHLHGKVTGPKGPPDLLPNPVSALKGRSTSPPQSAGTQLTAL